MKETLDYIKKIIKDFNPKIGIILGSGLGDFANENSLERYTISIPYSKIPGFEHSNITGHKGELVFSEIENQEIVIMQGRYHCYEGYSMQQVTYPVKVMKQLGIETLVITNAAGAINKKFKVGELMIIKDHINFMGNNPLVGNNEEMYGTKFPDMSEIYSKQLIKKAEKVAREAEVKIQKGIYVATIGPSYETPAEIKMFEKMGASAVGMSTVPEAIVAKWCGLNIVGISCLTNYAAGISQRPLSHLEVIETASKVKSSFSKFLKLLIREI